MNSIWEISMGTCLYLYSIPPCLEYTLLHQCPVLRALEGQVRDGMGNTPAMCSLMSYLYKCRKSQEAILHQTYSCPLFSFCSFLPISNLYIHIYYVSIKITLNASWEQHGI